MEGESLLLLEEPELSLNASIVQRLAAMIHKLQKKKKRQVILSTHSADLLSDNGIAGEEVLLLTPRHEGTIVQLASSIKEVRALLESGMSIGEAALPRTAPSEIHRIQQMEFDFK
jgi:predicted ATPase